METVNAGQGGCGGAQLYNRTGAYIYGCFFRPGDAMLMYADALTDD